MNSSEIRQSFFDFFESKGHTIVPSASLMPSSPNLLFTNAGMNQFVPYFLGDVKAPFKRAADTQKCIRAGGKHNDLEDVGFDTYHHTFFEMLGNWSFGDYFKKEAIHWAWELLTKVWKMPKERLYATVYEPKAGEPAEFDAEAYGYWEEIFKSEGLDPKVHIKKSGKKENFWMMGETGPCGPCSELHIDLTPNGDTQGALVNSDSPLCIEIWNLVFMQFNAQEDGTFVPLASKNIDTGMGLERIAGIMATTKNFTDFSVMASNYNSDLFTDIFKKISDMSGKTYSATIPADRSDMSLEELTDCIFRVLADHIRTLTFSIADGIMPGSEGRNYVLRRILRRAVMYGKRLGLKHGFFTKLADSVIEKMGPVFPELKAQRNVILKVLESEEKSFDRTLDTGLQLLDKITEKSSSISGEQAFVLYDTYGFPIDLTQLIARERKMEVDLEGFEAEMQKQRERARAAQKKEVITVADASEQGKATQFAGYDRANLENFSTKIAALVEGDDADFVVFEQTPFYAEKGGQVGDKGSFKIGDKEFEVLDTKANQAGVFLHKIAKACLDKKYVGESAILCVDQKRRRAIERHHSATHLLHWALREVLGTHVRQAGSYVDDQRMRFDFSHFEAISDADLKRIENLANSRILENAHVKKYEVPFTEVPKNCLAFFGDKYGAVVRVVDMGFHAELCGGTHIDNLGEIGMIKIVSEGAIASGIRRIEALAGSAAYGYCEGLQDEIKKISEMLACKGGDLEGQLAKFIESKLETERELKKLKRENAGKEAKDLAGEIVEKDGVSWIVKQVSAENTNELRELAVQIQKTSKVESLAVVLGADIGGKGAILALCSEGALAKGVKAGDIIKTIAPMMDGRGGGKPDFAQGGGSAAKLADALNSFKAKL